MHYTDRALARYEVTYEGYLTYRKWAEDVRRSLSVCPDRAPRDILIPHVETLLRLSRSLDQNLNRWDTDRQKQPTMHDITLELFQTKDALVRHSWDRTEGYFEGFIFFIDSMLMETLKFMHSRHITYYGTRVDIMRTDFGAEPESFYSDEVSLGVFRNFFNHAKDLASFLDIYRTTNLGTELKIQLADKKRGLLLAAWGDLVKHAGSQGGSADMAGYLAEEMVKEVKVAIDWLGEIW